MMKVFTVSVLCGILVWPISGFAELYKWTDEQGNLHITDIPPPAAHKKSASPSAKPSRSTPPPKITGQADASGVARTPVSPALDSMPTTSLTEGVPVQGATEGLSLHRATLVSPWQLFDGPQGNAKAPVHRWKDDRGGDHFTDVLPARKDAAAGVETSTKISTKLRSPVRRDNQ